MVDDSVLVALINESVTAPDRPRRIAARILLDVLRSDGDLDGAERKTELVTSGVASVADELRNLIDLHRLRSRDG